jgi:hypothetical protein
MMMTIRSVWHVLQDIYKPDPSRLRRHLSGIINFAKFREERLGHYTELQEECEVLLEESQQLEETNEGLVRSPAVLRPCLKCKEMTVRSR